MHFLERRIKADSDFGPVVASVAMSAALLAYLAARKRHKKEKKRREIDALIDALKDDEDRQDDIDERRLSHERKISEELKREASRAEERKREGFLGRWWRRIMSVIGNIGVQTLQYIIMLFCFQSLAFFLRFSRFDC